jgi:hypothetical protein
MVRHAVAAIATAAILAAAAPAALSAPSARLAGDGWRADAARNATCRHNLFLKSGIGPVTVRRTSCRRAIRALRRWVRAGMQGRGPRGWNCRRRVIGDEAPYTKVRCHRGTARMRFAINP